MLLAMTDDNTTIDHVVLPFDNISDDEFYGINTDVINNESHCDIMETGFGTFRYTKHGMCNYQMEVNPDNI